jgi:starch synthase
MKILFLAPEAKASPLPRALAALGQDVRLAVPLVGKPKGKPLIKVAVPTVYGPQVADVFAAKLNGIMVYSIATPRRPRSAPALTPDEQTIFFSLAAVALCRALDWMPDVLHALDPAYGAAIYWLDTDGLHDELLGGMATVLSVDEVDIPFIPVARALSTYGLGPSDLDHLPDEARDALAGLALGHADGIAATTDHNRHLLAELICSGNFAHLRFGWNGRMQGILPGLNLETWNPAHDAALRRRFDLARLPQRAANKRALQQALHLSVDEHTPLFALLTEYETPASLAVLLPALRDLLAGKAAAQVAVVGPLPEDLAVEFKALAQAQPARLALTRRRTDQLKRRVLAGADVLILAGRNSAEQLAVRLALRYGAVPLVHSLRLPPPGLWNYADQRSLSTAFIVKDYNSRAWLVAMQTAQAAFRRRAARYMGWPAIQQRGLREAARWGETDAANAFLRLYHHAIRVRKEKRQQVTDRLAEIPAGPAAAAPLT